jgi:hypothetical protein
VNTSRHKRPPNLKQPDGQPAPKRGGAFNHDDQHPRDLLHPERNRHGFGWISGIAVHPPKDFFDGGYQTLQQIGSAEHITAGAAGLRDRIAHELAFTPRPAI